MAEANEKAAFLADRKVAHRDRDLFVENVGKLAAQTRAGVEKIERVHTGQEELAVIYYIGGGKKYVNINADSYTAIVRDIFRYID